MVVAYALAGALAVIDLLAFGIVTLIRLFRGIS